MTYETVVQFVQTLGFPIAACVALFLRMNKQDERHQEETTALREALERNTQAITVLSERLGGSRYE